MMHLLEDLLDWIRWKISPVLPFFYAIHRLFFNCVRMIHDLSGSMLQQNVTWDVLWTSLPVCGSVTVVVRVQTSFGVDKKVEGFVSVQRSGGIHRIVLDGREVVSGDDGDTALGPPFYGSFYLPESVVWKVETRKVKSFNTSSIRGRCALLSFDRNHTGLTFLQITVLRNNPHNIEAKHATEAFEKAIVEAKEFASLLLKVQM